MVTYYEYEDYVFVVTGFPLMGDRRDNMLLMNARGPVKVIDVARIEERERTCAIFHWDGSVELYSGGEAHHGEREVEFERFYAKLEAC